MIRLPEPIDEELVHRAQMEARRKSLPAIANVRVEVFDEGAGHPGAPHRPVLRGARHDRDAERLHPEQGRAARGASPRDLPERPRAYEVGPESDRMKMFLRQPVS